MSRVPFKIHATDYAGNALAGAFIEVRRRDTQAPGVLYSDEVLDDVVEDPVTGPDGKLFAWIDADTTYEWRATYAEYVLPWEIYFAEVATGPPGPPGPQGPEGVWLSMTQAEYDALPEKDPDTLYVIIG